MHDSTYVYPTYRPFHSIQREVAPAIIKRTEDCEKEVNSIVYYTCVRIYIRTRTHVTNVSCGATLVYVLVCVYSVTP